MAINYCFLDHNKSEITYGGKIMYRGSKKTVLVFKGQDRSIFDEAHFIVRENISAPDDDIIKEANRIIAEYGDYKLKGQKSKKKEKSSIFWYISGIISGIILITLSAVILLILT